MVQSVAIEAILRTYSKTTRPIGLGNSIWESPIEEGTLETVIGLRPRHRCFGPLILSLFANSLGKSHLAHKSNSHVNKVSKLEWSNESPQNCI